MTDETPRTVRRHRLADRLVHWLGAACTLALLVTGFLPVFDVQFDWVTIHWISGLGLTAVVLVHIGRSVSGKRLANMWIRPRDLLSGGSLTGKYSAAQVLFHLAAAVLILATIVTGVIMLKGIDTPFWERDAFWVSESTRGILFVIHGLAALCLVTMIMLHVYFALRPEKLYLLRSMVLGWITRDEYVEHHDPGKWQEPGN